MKRDSFVSRRTDVYRLYLLYWAVARATYPKVVKFPFIFNFEIPPKATGWFAHSKIPLEQHLPRTSFDRLAVEREVAGADVMPHARAVLRRFLAATGDARLAFRAYPPIRTNGATATSPSVCRWLLHGNFFSSEPRDTSTGPTLIIITPQRRVFPSLHVRSSIFVFSSLTLKMAGVASGVSPWTLDVIDRVVKLTGLWPRRRRIWHRVVICFEIWKVTCRATLMLLCK